MTGLLRVASPPSLCAGAPPSECCGRNRSGLYHPTSLRALCGSGTPVGRLFFPVLHSSRDWEVL